MAGSPSHPLPPATAPAPWASLRSGGAPAMRTLLLATWVVAALAHAMLSPAQRVWAWPWGYLVLEVLATVSLAQRAWRCREEGLSWSLLTASAFLEVVNLSLMGLRNLGQLGRWVSDVSVLLTLGTGVVVLAGVLSFPRGPEPGRAFRRRVLDGLLFAVSLLFLLWVMGVQGSLRVAADGLGIRVFAAYLNAALIGGGLVFMTSYHPERIRGPLGWLAASALAWLVGVCWWALSGLAANNLEGPWLMVVGGIPLFQGLAAWSPRPVDASVSPGEEASRPARLLPYLPVVAALGALAILLPLAPLEVMRGAFGIFLLMVALLLLRQFQAVQDLQEARRTLEARVRQRTEALELAQDTLLRTERMNTLALMGAGLAHDLNNLLCAMKSSAELAALNLEEGAAPEPGDLLRIAAAADRASLLTRRLMGFVRREAEELAPTDLAREIGDLEATLRLLIPRSVSLHIDGSRGEPLMVRSSRLRVEQMLVNLVANAADAMPGGGAIWITTSAAQGDGSWAVIEVADTGAGMGPEILDRIFEPFFTTKPPGRGTGLGLSSLKALVEEGGGRLEVESQPGQGSRFRIHLPRLSEAESLVL